jgi:CsoR family transcriptional regulator, copper-sensing transcriptional repressor
MTDRDQRHGGTAVDHSRQLPRLRRIEGQIRGLQQMIGSGRDCVDIAHQIDAVAAALRRVQADMLRDHLEAIARAILSGELPEDERRRLTDELAKLIARRD